MVEQKKKKEIQYWLVVYSKDTGEFKNVSITAEDIHDYESISAIFGLNNPEYVAIHIGKGQLPPKKYRSLEYVSLL
jgi:hypothetical protein